MRERDALERIAEALERLAPPSPDSVDWSAHPAYYWDGVAARHLAELDALPLATLRGIEAQKQALRANLERLTTGAAAHDMLLWGSRGMGKSALIRAGVKAAGKAHPGRLALVQIAGDALGSVPALLEQLNHQNRAFVLLIDDLGFGAQEGSANLALRSIMDGGIMPRGPHIRLAVTSNRRAIVTRDAAEAGALHERDERDNALALADRFGLTLGFHPCDRATFLDILRAYTDPLGLTVDEEEALGFAIGRGNRSGRIAYQYACELAGRAGLSF